MRQNKMLNKLRDGRVTVGCFLGLESPCVAELLGNLGFDWLMIEAEHNGIDMAQVQNMVRAIETTAAAPLVRLPSGDTHWIQRTLDIGAMGIMVPLIRTADDARRVVAATRYPPEGKRSFGGLRATDYAINSEEYFRNSSENIAVILIIETAEALKNIDEIAAVSGVDALMMGSADLSLDLGLDVFRQPSPEIDEAFQRVLRATQTNNIASGAVYGTADQMRVRAEEGFRFLAFTDYHMLGAVARESLEAVSGIM